MCQSEDHHHGLSRDLDALLARRRMLTLMASAGAAGLLAGCDVVSPFARAEKEATAVSAAGVECVADPKETAGPFPADGSNRAHGTLANILKDSGIVRADMRRNLGGGAETAAPGATLELTATLVNIASACAPLKGHAVYLWHCDAAGRYSIYDLPEANYLRAVGESDADGKVKFTTIVPGCYAGRFPHMHFEVYPSLAKATDYRNRILTSQLAMPADLCRQVYESNRDYGASLENFARSPLDSDGIFADNTPKQLAAQTVSMSGGMATGYRGEVTIGVKA
jgi:protocatechuate 3,4-dioxygenase beta subunit